MCTSTQGASVTTLVDVLPLSAFRNLRRRFRIELNLSKFLQLRFNLFLMSILPISATKAYVWVLVRLYFLCRPGKVQAIRRNLARAMKDRTPSEINKITRGVVKGIVQHYQEKMLNGGLKTLQKNGSIDMETGLRNTPRHNTSRKVKDVKEDVRLNKALWSLTEHFAQEKRMLEL